MGSDKHYPEEAPVHRVTVDGFWIDRTPVTNRQFKEFVKATGHVTFAEIPPDPKDYPGALPHMLYAGSLVFTPPTQSGRSAQLERMVDLPEGRGLAPSLWPEEQHQRRSTIIRSCMSRSPTRSPTRNGPARTCRPRPNGNSPRAAGSTAPNLPGATSSRPAASIWPTPGRANSRARTSATDGFERTSPVTAFPPNGYGVHDMIGNVWEWTTDWYSHKHEADAPKACCIPENPRGGREDASYDACQPQHQDSTQGAQGRLASLRAELLPPLSAGCAPCGAGRHVDEPCRLQMHHQEPTESEDVVTGRRNASRSLERRKRAKRRGTQAARSAA